MVVGAVNLPVKAAESFEITGLASAARQADNSRWLIRWNSSVAIGTGDFANWLGGTNVTVNNGTTDKEVHVDWYDGGTSKVGFPINYTDVPENPEGYSITISSGTTLKYGGTDYSISNEITIKYESGAWKLSVLPTDFTITGMGSCGAQADNQRWLLRFQTSVAIPGTGFATHMGNKNITVSGGETTGTKSGSFYDGGENGTLGLIVPFTSIPASANGYTITIPAGTELTHGTTIYRLSKEVTCENVNGSWKLVVPPTDITITSAGECGRQDDQSRWLFRVNTTETISGTGFTTSIGSFNVSVFDGTDTSTKSASFYEGGNGTLGFIIPFTSIPQSADGYQVTLLAGTEFTYSGVTYKIAKDATLVCEDSKWTLLIPKTPFTITGMGSCGTQDGTLNRWLMRFNTSVPIEGAVFSDKLANVSVEINDVATTVSAYPSDVANLGIPISYTVLPKQPTEGTRLTIPAGVMGNYELTEPYTAVYTNGAWTTYVPAPEKTKFTITGVGDCGAQGDQNRWLMRFNTSVEIEGTAFSTCLAEYPILVNDTSVNAPMYPSDVKNLGVIIPFSTLQESPAEGTTITIPAGEIGDYELTEPYTAEYKDGVWQLYVPKVYSFNITGVGSCEYSAGSGWTLRFETDNSVDAKDFADGYVAYTIKVNGADSKAGCIGNASGVLEVLIPEDLEEKPQGSVVTIPAGTIGKYTLLAPYKVVYDGESWKLAHEGTPFTLTMANDRGDIQIYNTPDAGNVIGSGVYSPTYADSGVYLNGRKLDGVGINCYAPAASAGGKAHFHITADSTGWNEVEDNILTIRGTFNYGDTYLEIAEISTRFNGSTWVSSHSYENFNRITITNYETGGWQPADLNRWLFRLSTSTPIEAIGSEFGKHFGDLSVTITPKDGTPTTISAPTYRANNATNTAVNRLGLIITAAQGLPEEAEGYSITIHPGLVITENKTYRITEEATIRCVGGTWQLQTDRPASKGVVGDANGNGAFNAADLVSALKEFNDTADYLCTTDALFAGKTKVTEYDTIHIRELLLEGPVVDASTYVPLYLDDEDIELAAYKGPRAEDRDFRYDDNGNMLSGYTKTNFLTDTEFARYAAAGLNTLIAESDAPFASENGDLMASGGGHWTNIVSYMELAANHGLDVYLTSEAVNAYLRGNQATQLTGNKVTVTDAFMQADLTQLLTGVGSATHGGITSQYNPTGKLEGMLDYDNFKGIMLADEIRYDSLSYYTTVNQFLRSIAPDIEVITAFESSDKSVGADYKTFASDYANASLSNTFIYDYYPFQGQATKKINISTMKREYNFDAVTPTTNADWVTKLEELAGYALSGGFETGIALTSMGMNNHSTGIKYGAPTAKKDIGFQVYTSLAYGMKNIKYFTYWEHEAQAANNDKLGQGKVGEIYTNSMVTVDASGNVVETDIYRAVQAVNKEILQFDHVFLDYDWRSTIKAGTGDQLTGLTQGSSDRIATYSATNAAIIGCMKDTDKDLDGFWLVNATEPEENKSSNVTVKFNDATRAMVYNPATKTYGDVIDLTEGTYTANLGSGEGQFVIPLK